MKIKVIIAIYYPQYLKKVKEEISRIFAGKDYQVLFVSNNDKCNINENENSNSFWIKGSNCAGEFSAWDEGYAFLKDKELLSENDIVVFMNDTFCHHRLFTFYDRVLYRKAILSCSDINILGEVNAIGDIFYINNFPLSSWISSYIFFGKKNNIDKLLPFNKTNTLDNKDILHIESELKNNKVDVPFFSRELNEHLTKWLFPSNASGWYKANKTSSAILFFKLKAIVNEKLLAYNILSKDILIEDIYEGQMNRIYNSIRYRVYHLCKKYKLL